MVALFQRRHAGADIDHDPRPLMAEDGREKTFGIGAGAGEFVGVADPTCLDLDQHFPSPGTFQVHRLDHQGLSGGIGDGGSCFHWRKGSLDWPRMCGIWVMVAKC